MRTHRSFLPMLTWILLWPGQPLSAAQEGEVAILHGPYLQNATRTSMTIKWETTTPADSTVEYGEQTPPDRKATAEGARTLHEIVLTGLQPQTNYLYRVVSRTATGQQIASELLTFQTAVEAETAFSFIVVGDTQTHVDTSGAIAELAWRERPNLVLHCGDIVGSGSVKEQWTNEFFRPYGVLISRVPLFAVPGNHDQNSHWFYDYMANPGRENFYSFRFGNAYFAMIDSNQEVKPGSEQYGWLERDLAANQDATWKFAVFHHPPYSSDENDYGNTYEGPSTYGDLDTRQLVPLFERYGVDLVFNGHIHNYERTWPLRENQVNQEQGVIYVICGGSGGGLENWAPTRTWFTAKLVRDHHFVQVAIHNRTLRLECIDIEGRLRDLVEIRKPSQRQD